MYVSTTAGARNTAQFTWNASQAGKYIVRLSTDCETGTLLTQGDYATPGQDITLPISAGSYAPGATPVCVRVTSTTGGFGEKTAFVIRDDDAPTVTVTPGAGAYSNQPTISVSCTDPGGSGCGLAAMRIGADPSMDLNGVLVGTEYTGPFNPPDSATTAYRFKIMDKAGNQSIVATASYTVDTVLPVITLNSVSPASQAVSTGSVSFSYKSNVKGTATLHMGDCSGTLLATSSIATLNGLLNRSISFSGAVMTSNFVAGPNDVALCVQNTAGLVGSTTKTFTRDNTLPTITSITVPSGTVDPESMTFLVNFSEPMSPYICPVSVTYQGATVSCPENATWITSQSLQVKLYPVENANVTWSLVGLQDLAANAVSGLPSGSFRTGMQAKRRFPVTETRQTLCYDAAGSAIPCAGTGQNGLNPSGPLPMLLSGPSAPNAAYPMDAVVTDSRTGLMWMVCPTTQTWSGVSCTGSIFINNWTSAWSDVRDMNIRNSNAGYAGFTDWRLPTLAELSTIKVYEGAPLPSSFFPNAANRFYWTSTTSGAASVYYMMFMSPGGDTFLDSSPIGTSGVSLLVRDPNPGAAPANFVDNANGIIWDPLNQLYWQKCSSGQVTADCSDATNIMLFDPAVSYCSNLALDGRIWRVPTIKELKSIVDTSATSAPFVFPEFPGTVGEYWSSTTNQYNPTRQYGLVSSNGAGTGLDRNGGSGWGPVRCVSP
ncbi:MAG: DUF1566 domain-containing protein [Spirochaetia bacterium]|nr:DUF1566 domain-containing protein [Spirochaetia bacterium]